jgi:hypothetical protein
MTNPKPVKNVAMLYEQEWIRGPVCELDSYQRGGLPLQEIEDIVGDLNDPANGDQFRTEL